MKTIPKTPIKAVVLIILALALMSSIASATYDLSIPNYIGVNETGTITIDNTETIASNENAYLILDGIAYQFQETTNQYTIGATSTIEEDKNIIIQISNSTIKYYNYHDNTNESSITIINNSFYGAQNTQINETHLKGKIEQHEICLFIKKNTAQNPTIQLFSWYNNGTTWKTSLSTTYTITNTNYATNCYSLAQNYTDTMINFTEYIGFKCTDCQTGLKTLDLGIDTNGTRTNKTFTSTNQTTIVNLTTGNYIISYYDEDSIPIQEYTGTLKFRIPFYVDVSLYTTKNETLDTKFDYVYLRKNGRTTINPNYVYDVIRILSLSTAVPFKADYTETHWAHVVGSTAHIKLYETGNYAITLQTMKTYKAGWKYEFIKPQYTNLIVETTLDKAVRFDVKNDTQVDIQLSGYEANKSQFVWNKIKWFFFILINIIIIIVAFMSGPEMAWALVGIGILDVLFLIVNALMTWLKIW